MSLDGATLDAAHKHCISHRIEVLASAVCGCFYCRSVFPPKAVTYWHEETSGEAGRAPDPFTAFCPTCHIDAVIGDASGYPVSDPTFLRAMHARWFKNEIE
ncbi:hypothetical protein ACLBKU_05235 [Erythrobacter sp. NE805]|uniref:hypothetical protein n=1 Tax=Erythrobacter sp. NE805 TaxID=3389875 RepID=UPI00396B109D